MTGFPIPIETIVNTLHRLGVKDGDSLLTHTAFRSLFRGSKEKLTEVGSSELYARDLIRALRDICGPTGALMMPTEFLPDYQIASFQGRPFDLRSAPTNRGFLCQQLLELPEARRSTNPIYNIAAVGGGFEELLDEHYKYEYSMDKGSPWWEFSERGGKIVYLGASLDSNSCIHMPEYVLKNEYPKPVFFSRPHEFNLIDLRGRPYRARAYVHAIRWGSGVVTKACRYLHYRHRILNEAFIGTTPIVVVEARLQYKALIKELELGFCWYDAMTWI
jgi:aminoglycoside N3'-acetyltransferase